MTNEPLDTDLNSGPAIAAFVHSVAIAMGGRRSPMVVQDAFAGLTDLADVDAVAAACNTLGIWAAPLSGPPVSWRDALDGAVLAKIDGSWAAIVRHEGDIQILPEGSAITEADILAARDFVMLRMVPEAGASSLTFELFATRARKMFRHVIWLSMVINLCALSVPFFTMAVYDRVLGGGARGALWALLSGALIVLALMYALRRARARLITNEHARLSASISLALARKVFRQPYAQRIGLTPDRALGSLRRGERAADLFSSNNVAAIYDAPFVALTLLAIGIVGGGMVVVPLLYLVMFLVLGLCIAQNHSSTDPEAAKHAAERQVRLEELATNAGPIRQSGLGTAWIRRFDRVTRSVSRDVFQSQKRNGAVQALGYVLGTGTALATLVIGLERVLAGTFSAGALMAIMLLTWRVTGPAQAFFLAIPRLKTLRGSWDQLKLSLSRPTISGNVHTQESFPNTAPAFSGQGLYYRYPSSATPAVSGLSFDVPAGSTVVILGPNGSGKTTLLRLLAGVVATQSGSFLANGRAFDQYDIDDYSSKITFVPAGTADFADQLAKTSTAFFLDNPGEDDVTGSHDILTRFIADRKGAATLFVASHDTNLAEHADFAIVLDRGSLAYFGPVKKPDASDTAEETLKEST